MTSTPSTYLYERVEAQVRNLIEQQMLRPGERIPSLRRMSDQARVSLATVMQAYMSLERKGLIEARAKSGFYVRPDAFDGPPIPNPLKLICRRAGCLPRTWPRPYSAPQRSRASCRLVLPTLRQRYCR